MQTSVRLFSGVSDHVCYERLRERTATAFWVLRSFLEAVWAWSTERRDSPAGLGMSAAGTGKTGMSKSKISVWSEMTGIEVMEMPVKPNPQKAIPQLIKAPHGMADVASATEFIGPRDLCAHSTQTN